jgi:hypothetical protein
MGDLDPRGPFRVAAAAVSGALTLTLNAVFPDVPTEIWIAWGAAIMAIVGVGEVIYDGRRKPVVPVP